MPSRSEHLNRQIVASRDSDLFLEYLENLENEVADVRIGDTPEELRKPITLILRARIDTLRKYQQTINDRNTESENDDV